MQNESRHLSK
jgi:hypothetical protein